jgi:predicted anti-sigma-YlaC factor YlaD
MLDHENKNPILNLYFHEGTRREERRIENHLRQCSDCRGYLESLENIDRMLTVWKDESPHPDTFQNILKRLPSRIPAARSVRTAVSFIPIIEIAAALIVILTGLYGLQSLFHRLPVWKVLEQNWIIQSLGSFGVTIALFFASGTFVTFCLAPILLLESRRRQPVRQMV